MASLFANAGTSASGSKLAALFSTSSRPVKQSSQQTKHRAAASSANDQIDNEEISEADEAEIDALDDASEGSESSVESSDADDADVPSEAENDSADVQDDTPAVLADAKANGHKPSSDKPESRRKRKRADDDLEAVYLDRIAREEDREEQMRRDKRQKHQSDVAATTSSALASQPIKNATSAADRAAEADEASDEEYTVPQHESVADAGNPDIEQASRTVFLGNVANSAITSKSDKKKLMVHLSSFLPGLPTSKHPHKIESFRFRSTAYATPVPKKAAFAKQEVMDATAKSTNAYVVYSTKVASREAARQLNGTVILDRHLRVDEVAHPAKVDHHRCVFVGNLNFVDDETQMKEAEAKAGEKTGKARNGDVEEGLWRQFGKAGTVESVRVVRDPKTRVSKGFAYVQFTHENGVEAALLFNDKKFPPLLPRKLRVVRAKKFKKSDIRTQQQNSTPIQRNPKGSSRDPREQSMNGRAKKLLGRAGAAIGGDKASGQSFKKPESFVFEGHRASSKQGGGGVKSNRSGKKKGRPTDRSAKRGAAWKSRGEKGAKN